MQLVPFNPGYILTFSAVVGALFFLSRNRNKQRTRNQGPAQREDNSAPASKLPDENNDSNADER
jgi:hypothetical protein